MPPRARGLPGGGAVAGRAASGRGKGAGGSSGTA
jgi:hypothetical protein